MRSCSAALLVRIFSWTAAASFSADFCAGEETPDRPAKGVQDNSFFIEEAYNQEAGVVQHILNIVPTLNRRSGGDERELSFVFTQEWPVFTQAHQFSYTLPYAFTDSGDDSANGIEDIGLNYRYQLLMESETLPAFAPRFTLLLPSGDAAEGFGNDTVGYQINLPVSKILADRWTVHGNAGATFLPDVERNDLFGYNLGASAIYAVTSNFNLMLEAIANWDEEAISPGRTDKTVSALISPGFRYAFNHANDAQTVVGLAVPIGLTSDAPDYGVFIYASFEHFFFRPKATVGGK